MSGDFYDGELGTGGAGGAGGAGAEGGVGEVHITSGAGRARIAGISDASGAGGASGASGAERAGIGTGIAGGAGRERADGAVGPDGACAAVFADDARGAKGSLVAGEGASWTGLASCTRRAEKIAAPDAGETGIAVGAGGADRTGAVCGARDVYAAAEFAGGAGGDLGGVDAEGAEVLRQMTDVGDDIGHERETARAAQPVRLGLGRNEHDQAAVARA